MESKKIIPHVSSQKTVQQDLFFEENVIFYHWLVYCQPRPIPYPYNEKLWIYVCRFGLRSVLTSALLNVEYQQWLRYRASAQRQLGERFLEDDDCKHLHRSTDVQVKASRKYWNV